MRAHGNKRWTNKMSWDGHRRNELLLDDGVLEHAESIRWLSRVKAATVCFR